MMPALGQSQFIARYRSDWLLLLLQAGRQAGRQLGELSELQQRTNQGPGVGCCMMRERLVGRVPGGSWGCGFCESVRRGAVAVCQIIGWIKNLVGIPGGEAAAACEASPPSPVIF